VFRSLCRLGVDSDRPYAGSTDGNFFDYTLREPLGVVAGIASWNFPLLNAAWKIAAPLAAGNCVVFNPASDTVLSALVLAQIAAEADLPAGVLNIIAGSGTSAGQPLAAHPGTDKISFTGSTPTGRIIGHTAVEDFRCCTLELGGKSPNIVFDDCDLDKAVKGALWAIFFNAGQVCTAGSRLLLQDSICQVFMQDFIEEASNIQVGDPMDKATRMGPLVSNNQQETVMNFINSARDAGLPATIGGARPDGLDTGYYIQPTIYENVPSDHPLNREEIFGPVLVVHRFKDEQDAIRQANDTPYGLAAGLWTRDLSRAHRLANRLHAGTVWINTYNFAFTNIPNPGHKHSGLGMELGREGFEAYTRIKNVCIDLDSKPIDYFN